MHRPVTRSHVRTVLSSEAERRNLPEGWKTSARIQLSSTKHGEGSALATAESERQGIRTAGLERCEVSLRAN